MKAALPFAIALLVPFAASAEGFPADRIVAAASGDWDKDGSMDLVVIARPAEGIDEDNGVYIYLADPSETRLKLTVAVPNKLWGNMAISGQEPELAALANGSFSLVTKNEAVGRDRWRQSLTIAYRNSEFVVAGYSYTSYDTLDPDDAHSCDLNVLTGKGKVDEKPRAARAAMIGLKDWNDEIGETFCQPN